MTVDREGRPRQRTRSQRQHVNPLVAVGQTLCIAAEHGHIREQVMSEQDRLGTLQMRISRYNRLYIVFSLLNQSFLQLTQQSDELHHPVTEIQMHIRRHLVVAAAAGVQLTADRTDFFDQVFFNIHMNIFIGNGEFDCACAHLIQHLVQPGFDGLNILLRQDAAFAQHGDMGQTALYIFFRQCLIKSDGCCILLHQLVRSFGKPSAPKLAHLLCPPLPDARGPLQS
ncbi:hypothetical protein D3C73_991750 [compost metagenome]